jgi:uncharacterized protein YggT (Ycf19 family)
MEQRGFGTTMKKIFVEYNTYIIFVFLFIICSVLSDQFFTEMNIRNILLQRSAPVCAAIGMLFVILTGGIDLSVGSVMAFAASLSAADIELEEDDREAAIELIGFMYKRADLASFCRRAILKAYQGRDELESVWAEAIRRVCSERSIDYEAVPLLWRDCNLLPNDKRAIVGDEIWKAFGTKSGVHAIVASLSLWK